MNDHNTAVSSHEAEHEDIQVSLREGRPIRQHGPYRVAIGNDRLEYNYVTLVDAVITGQQMLSEAGFHPEDEYLLLQMLKSGELAELRLDETIDLRTAGVTQFLVFRTDRTFRFELDGTFLEWGSNLISGATLKKLASVDPVKYGVWQEMRGGEDKPIANSDLVDLATPGVERFFTGIVQTTEG